MTWEEEENTGSIDKWQEWTRGEQEISESVLSFLELGGKQRKIDT